MTNPDGPNWSQDGISTGKIVLVRYGEEWDILFDDSVGASGYRQDGATVVPLISKGSLLSVGAFHSNYADVYTFDFVGRQVAWTSNKLGPIVPKVAVYQANCD
ncbi:hypothetical protein GCM10011498_20320 [Amylibacter cionae]|uniref:Uncharacterized protein n=1 Tax=Neptunicoccus cionae TaxID=2035344 RepID=A0A916QY86_9RHOB|nr:hypothetical protein GCM10011498_20320 [Amylibacter cionae]